eukprot:2693777-Amphidinium_carterae.1
MLIAPPQQREGIIIVNETFFEPDACTVHSCTHNGPKCAIHCTVGYAHCTITDHTIAVWLKKSAFRKECCALMLPLMRLQLTWVWSTAAHHGSATCSTFSPNATEKQSQHYVAIATRA